MNISLFTPSHSMTPLTGEITQTNGNHRFPGKPKHNAFSVRLFSIFCCRLKDSPRATDGRTKGRTTPRRSQRQKLMDDGGNEGRPDICQGSLTFSRSKTRSVVTDGFLTCVKPRRQRRASVPSGSPGSGWKKAKCEVEEQEFLLFSRKIIPPWKIWKLEVNTFTVSILIAAIKTDGLPWWNSRAAQPLGMEKDKGSEGIRCPWARGSRYGIGMWEMRRKRIPQRGIFLH